ncbi:MAG TPA: DUF488 domain-containing protein [Acetobacteraceae bacterium]|nr:DUF488 domain-containing protein [Acetobacteraceae bacterium]
MAAPRIATIGYEGLPQADFLALLRASGISRVADVRAIANSRRPGYAKRALSAALEGVGIEYVHIPALGTPAAGRAAVRAGRPGEMRRIYLPHLATPEPQAALAALAADASATPTCLLCLEADPTHCHRTLIATAMHERWGFVVHPLGLPAL